MCHILIVPHRKKKYRGATFSTERCIPTGMRSIRSLYFVALPAFMPLAITSSFVRIMPHKIDPDKCIKCGECRKTCKFDAVIGV
jgi:NAD-dependent dihydropyrimidine dehydrogenase PreA subunit